MSFPRLHNTPIKEIVFSIFYEGDVEKECFDAFVNLEFVQNNFNEIKPSETNSISITNDGIKHSTANTGFHLKNDNEILQMRMGSISYHYLNNYREFEEMLSILMSYWDALQGTSQKQFKVNEIAVRYINVIEIDREHPASHLIQLYPKQSEDRKIINFQNVVNFTYLCSPKINVNLVSTKPTDDFVLLDISVNTLINYTVNQNEIKNEFIPLQEIKNKAFFDSITAKALLKYLV